VTTKDIKVGRFYLFSGNGYTHQLEFVNRVCVDDIHYTAIRLDSFVRIPYTVDTKINYCCSIRALHLIQLKLLYGENKEIMDWVGEQLKSARSDNG